MRVLFWSPYSSWPLHAAHEATLAQALRRRGAEVRTFLCNALFPECDVYRRNINWGTTGRPDFACEMCQFSSLHQHVAAGNTFEWLGVYVPRDVYGRARAFVDSLAPEALLEARWEGRAVGAWAQSSAFYQFRMSTCRLDSPEVVKSLRDHVYGSIVAWEGLRHAWDELKPDVLVTFNGRFFSHRAAAEIAQERGVPVVVHERGIERDTIRVHRGPTTLDLAFYDATWATWGDIPLDAASVRQVHRWMQDRRQQRNMGWLPFSPKPQDVARVREVLRLDERPIVAMFTSSDDEMAVYRDWRDGAFPDSLAWIPASVELARRMPDVQWVIRMHPNLSGLGVNQEAVEQAQALAKALPENVRIVMPKDDVSSYTIADIAAIGVVYMTTMGLEMAARGQRVVAVARGWYGNSGIVEYVTRPEDYETAVRAALRAPRSMRRAQQTYRLLYRLNLQWSLPFPLVRYKGVDGVRAWKDVSELDPGKDPVLDRICATILEGTPTTDPPGPADLARSDAAEVASLLCVDPWLAEAEDQPERREADLLVAEGEAAYADGDLARARRSLLRATECEPDHPTAWMDLGAVLHAQGEGVAAVRALARAVNLNPLWSDAWTNLIAALMEQGSVADARRVLDAACAVLPDDPGLRALRASLV